jgi:TonB-linked SusC/RagA family outer membrane protein
MTYQKALLLFFVLLCGRIAFSQERTIKGKVTDEAGKGPVAGATVIVKGTNNAVSTDAQGAFAVKAPAGTVILIISSVGYATKEITASTSSGELTITLGTDSKQLGEVVVTALGITRQAKSLVYATQTVKPSQLTEVRDPNNVINGLQGKIANALIIQGSGGVGSGANIILRGSKSLQSTNTALIVVDGVPITNNTYTSATNDFGSVQSSDGAGDINADDIESMNVLRGASAAALYGSQAANGVLVIQTKKGKKSGVEVTFNSGIGFEKAWAMPKFQNIYAQGNNDTLKDNSLQGASWGPKMTGQSYVDYLGNSEKATPQPDNVKDFFRTGTNFTNYIGVAAGGEKTQSYLSYTNNYARGIIRNNDLNKHTFTYHISTTFNKHLSTDAKVTYINQSINGRPRTGEENSPVVDAYEMPRSVSIRQAMNYQTRDALGVTTPTPWASTYNSIYQNPFWMIYNTSIGEARNRINGYASVKYAITPWLNLTGRVNYDRSASHFEEKYQMGTLLWNTNYGGSYGITDVVYAQKWFDLILQGNNTITRDLKVDYLLGGLYQQVTSDVNSASTNGLTVVNKFNLNYASNPTTAQDGSEVQVHAAFGQANFSWRDAIYLTATARYDYNSTIAPPYRIFYPSVGASAILSELVTLPDAISFLKVSANYAKVGNGGQFAIRFPSYTFYPGAGNGNIGRTPTMPIAGLKPEQTTSKEGSLEAHFLKDRIGFTATYYHTNSVNQLLTVNIPVGTGYSNTYINAGNVENHGFELIVNGTPVRGRDFTWETQLNFSLNRNKVLKLTEDLKYIDIGGGNIRSAQPRIYEGGSMGDLYAHTWMKDSKGQLLVVGDASKPNYGAPLTTYGTSGPVSYIGNYNPRYNLGWTNTFTYKGFSLRVLLDGRIGGIIVSGTEMNLAASGIVDVTAKYREGGWNLGGVDNSGGAISKTINAQTFWQTVSGIRYGTGQLFTYDATNFRVRELSIGYDIPVHVDFIKSLRFSAVARNLLWIYRGKSKFDIPGLAKRTMWMDPDMSIGNGNFQGTEYGAMPSSRTMGFNLKATF